MKTKQQILSMLFANVAEYESCNPTGALKEFLQTRIGLLQNILGEDIPEEYWDRIDNIISD